MCGIAGYAGSQPALPFMIDALKRLEYRGYDSWGYATFDGGKLDSLFHAIGMPSKSEVTQSSTATVGIGHTRWATHGKVSTQNTHPVRGGKRRFNVKDNEEVSTTTWVVHNGIIENHGQLRELLERLGYVFETETDTEVIAHSFDYLVIKRLQNEHDQWLTNSMRSLVSVLEGSYSFALVSTHCPGSLLVACNGSPLLITRDGHVASESVALVGYAKTAFRMQDGYMGHIKNGRVTCFDQLSEVGISTRFKEVAVPVTADEGLVWSPGDYPHCMMKEICEQPEVVQEKRTVVRLDSKRPTQVVLFGCGSSYNAALLSRDIFETFSGVQTTVEYASEFSHRFMQHYPENTRFIAITQSGETKDTLNAIQHVLSKRDQDNLVVITNTRDSTAASCDANLILLNAGPERGVAATKTFVATYVALVELAIRWNRHGERQGKDDCLFDLLSPAMSVLLSEEFVVQVRTVAKFVVGYSHVLYLGRGSNYPLAREGALKLKEVSYIHAEAMPAAEMKHGPIALIDDNTLSVFIVTDDAREQEKVLSNMEEVKARGGSILAITDDVTSTAAGKLANWELRHPRLGPLLQPVLTSMVLQLLAYYAAVELHRDVDRPRNLSKTVTVE